MIIDADPSVFTGILIDKFSSVKIPKKLSTKLNDIAKTLFLNLGNFLKSRSQHIKKITAFCIVAQFKDTVFLDHLDSVLIKVHKVDTTVFLCKTSYDLIIKLDISKLCLRDKGCRSERLIWSAAFIILDRIFDTERDSSYSQRNINFRNRKSLINAVHILTIHIRIIGRKYTRLYSRLGIIIYNCRQPEISHTAVTGTHFLCCDPVFPVVDIDLFQRTLVSVFGIIKSLFSLDLIGDITDTLIDNCNIILFFNKNQSAFNAYLVISAAIGKHVSPCINCLLLARFNASFNSLIKNLKIVLIKNLAEVRSQEFFFGNVHPKFIKKPYINISNKRQSILISYNGCRFTEFVLNQFGVIHKTSAP